MDIRTSVLQTVSAVVGLVAMVVTGCGDSGIPRLDLSGAVTYDGLPVPAGELRFEPNRSKGGAGPVGFASIVNGRYDTRAQDKGPLSGPVRVTIKGYESGKAFAPQLFPQHQVEIEIEKSDYNLDFDVPKKP